jgi:hypothetical protein
MAYKVIVTFSDLEDNGHLYSVGDVYPRKEVTPTLDRVEFLLSCRNLLGKPVIEKTDTEEGTNEVTTEVKPVMNVPEKPIEATTGSAASKDVQEKPKRGRRKKA